MASNSTKALSGKVALVTGGASGIGLAIVNLFHESGAQVAVLDIQSSDGLPATENVQFVKADISSEESVKAAMSEVLSKWGRLDILVNNAGIMDNMSKTGDVANEMWEKVLAVNLNGPFYLSRLALQTFMTQETRGNIVNVCSTASIRGSAAGAAYTASKHALLGLSRSTAWGYAKDGIRCNAVLPGGVETSIVKNIAIDNVGMQALNPCFATMPGFCQPSDVAAAVLFLVTANAVNGAELTVDRGWTVA